MNDFIKSFYINDLEYISRIIIAVICGFTIGFEREYKRKDAGTSTHVIVALGASLTMILSAYGFNNHPNIDPTRMAAQVISGIGFLGAGLIFVRGGRTISGLTTAAGIWTTSIIAMTIGSGKVLLGVFCTILLSLGNLLLSKFKPKYHISNEEIIIIDVLKDDFKFKDFYSFLEDMNIKVLTLDISKSSYSRLKITTNVILPRKFNQWEFDDKLMHINGILKVKYY